MKSFIKAAVAIVIGTIVLNVVGHIIGIHSFLGAVMLSLAGFVLLNKSLRREFMSLIKGGC